MSRARHGEAASPPRPGVSALVRNGAGEVLLVLRGKEPFAGHWSLPGGLVEAGESAEEAVHREIREETGLAMRLRRVLRVLDIGDPRNDDDGGTPLYRLTVFLADAVPGEVAAGSDAADAGWFRLDELDGMRLTPGTALLIREEGRG